MKTIFAISMTLLLGASSLGMSGDKMFEGRVVEYETGKPVVDAFVIAKWMHYGSDPVGSRTSCTGLEIVKTDEMGRFRIPLSGLFSSRPDSVFAYKIGFEEVPYPPTRSKEEDLRTLAERRLRPFTAKWEERLKSFTRYGTLRICRASSREELIGKLEPLYKALDEETATLSIPASTNPLIFRQGMYSKSLESMRQAKEWK